MKPRIFISAVSSEFLEIRKQVALILSGLGYEPVVQELFTTASGDLREMHKTKIDSCGGLVQIVGDAYGYEPPNPDPEFGRCSFTQFEYFYAKQQKKEVWVIHAQQGCSTSAKVSQLDLPAPEENLSNEQAITYQKERRDLQIAYRKRLEAEGQIMHAVNSDDGLALKLNSLKDELARLTIAFKSWQKWVATTLGAVVLMLIAGGMYFIKSMDDARKHWSDSNNKIAGTITDAIKKEWDIEDYRTGLMVAAGRTYTQALEKVETIEDWKEKRDAKKRIEAEHKARLEQLHSTIKMIQADYLAGRVSEITREFDRIVANKAQGGLDAALEYFDSEQEAKVLARAEAKSKEQQTELMPLLRAADGHYLKGNLSESIRLCEAILKIHPGWNDVWHLGYLANLELTTKFLSSRGPQAARTHAEKSYHYSILFVKYEPKNQTAQRDLSTAHNILGDIFLKEGNLPEVRTQYEQSLAIREKLANEDKTNANAQRELAVAYDKLGTIFLEEGNLPKTRKQNEKALTIFERLAVADKTNADAQRDLSVAYNNLGNIFLKEGNLSEARRQYEQSLAISEKLASADKTDAQAQRDLAVSYDKLGDIFLKEGNTPEARRQYEQSLIIVKNLASADKTDAGAQRDLSVSYNKLGDIFLQEGNIPEARRQYEQSLTISKELASADKTDAQAQRDLSVSYNKLGDIFLQEGNLPEARRQYEQSLTIRKELASADKTNAQAQRDLSVSYDKLGDIFLQEGNLSEARRQYGQSLTIAKELTSADKTNAQAQRDLSVSYNKLGNIFLQEGNLSEARRQYGQSLTIAKELASADKTNAQTQIDLMISNYKLGNLLTKSEETREAGVVHFQAGLDILLKLEKSNQLKPNRKSNIKILEELIKKHTKE
ncbi:tetratricopeptide repeat protein [Gimesia aquarii]|uniref:Tetratricopeptide repeat protein n=1 Tax=Gimesia aquarii TaxID=2527964 RepID=A0A517VYF3_9PLAN|nr:tetratricopeptide repeat protein [Gimesia aquarii]QDT98036.1 Tetratricopeptide repeat protein [Gimesia aquarii]